MTTYGGDGQAPENRQPTIAARRPTMTEHSQKPTTAEEYRNNELRSDDDSGDLIEFITEGDDSDKVAGGILEEIEAEFEELGDI